jgi:very-short-patch-repair endonuclease
LTKIAPAATALSRKLKATQTDAERRLWFELRLRQMGVKFRRQHPIGKYVVDFVCLEVRLCVELDGSQHVARSAYDARRTKFLESRGFEVLRFWDNDVLTDIDSVKEVIWIALARLSPPPP